MDGRSLTVHTRDDMCQTGSTTPVAMTKCVHTNRHFWQYLACIGYAISNNVDINGDGKENVDDYDDDNNDDYDHHHHYNY